MQQAEPQSPPEGLGPIQRSAENFHKSVRESVRIFRENHLGMKLAVTQFRAAYINALLSDCNGNQSRAAKEAGVHRNTLQREIQQMKRAGLLSANLRGSGNSERRKQVQRARAQAAAMGVKLGTA